jgi:hypothetical protein
MIEMPKSIRRSTTDRDQVRQHRCRNGFTMVELVISAMMLVTVMTFVTTLSYSINLVWKDIGHHRVAANELANQLESLTRLPKQDAQIAVSSLEPSELCRRTLKDPELSGQLVEDNLGTRVVLSINWNRRNPGKPVQLVGWVFQKNGSLETASNKEADQ